MIQPMKEMHVLQITCVNMPSGIKDKLRDSFPDLVFLISGDDFIRIEAECLIHVGPLVRFLEDHEAEDVEARRVRPSLEDIFVEITGIEANAMRKEKEKKGGGR